MDYSCERAHIMGGFRINPALYGMGSRGPSGKGTARPRLPAPRFVNATYGTVAWKNGGQPQPPQPRPPDMRKRNHGDEILLNPSLNEKGSLNMGPNIAAQPHPPCISIRSMSRPSPHWSPVASRVNWSRYGDLPDANMHPRQGERNDIHTVEARTRIFEGAKKAIPAVSPVTGLPFVARGPQPTVVAPTRFKENHYKRSKRFKREKTHHVGADLWVQGLVYTKQVVSPPPSPKHRPREKPRVKERRIHDDNEKKGGGGGGGGGGVSSVKTSKFVTAFMNLFR